MNRKHRIGMRVLPGEYTDGSGRVCIHLFVQDETGPFTEPSALHPVMGADGQFVKQQVEARPTRGRLACDRSKTVAPVVRKDITIVTLRTDDYRAVTCSRCMVSEDYRSMIPRTQE